MFRFQNIYNWFHSFFEFFTFRTKPKYEMIDTNDDDYNEYDFSIVNIIVNEKMTR
jgi:hypothetical protein